MENAILKKKLNTFKTGKGSLKNVNNDVVMEVLRTWEHWAGSSGDLQRELGISKMQMANMIKQAKRLIKSGVVIESEFKELKLQSPQLAGVPCSEIEILWGEGKIIRFSQVDLLVDFLKKAA